MSVASIEDVKCFGESDGEIILDIQGGVAPFNFTWSHDPVLSTSTAEDLPTGTYSVTIKDQLGCERFLENLQINEPPALEIVSVDVQAVSCFGKKDGVLNLNVRGGTGPYQVDLEDGFEFTGNLKLSDVSQGTYELNVVDQNGCSVPLSFEISSPAALEVDVRLTKPACPGGSNGELFAFPAGGIAPYIYLWEEENVASNELIGLSKGSYPVSVTDASGCVSLGTGLVVENAPEVRMPTGYNPYRDGGLFEGVSNCDLNFDIWIFNRWGQLIYQGKEGWNGLVNGENATLGTYTYLMQYSFQLDDVVQTVEKRGSFLLVR